MTKILSLIGATTITTSGVTPLMAMMPNNNQRKAPTLQEIITNNNINIGYIYKNKVDKQTILNNLKEKKEIFLSQEIFIENLEIIGDIFLEDKDLKQQYVNGYIKIKLKENSNIYIKNKRIPEEIIYTINFHTNNRKYNNKFKWNNRQWKDYYC
ncbi:hypothetical protein [Spiroplasma phoeniceum]|uniref:Uncharacterized protein n=1 Tax=Spiroplasma phoeniceum P40 TaxID=1276259 RepID=A0A345DPV7_9MOLU|nr:hypothetical protein [Spiroplasma phoeniceum]AXF96245.1 hypothetical protein SDAV_001278 [Spiroplasma phoeniceum P40]